MAEKKLTGTVRVYGCPAEEGGSGKVFMVREGLFNDVDIAIHWHPADGNSITVTSALANKSAKFRFHGIAAHAAASPEKGRSSLDAVEAMDNMVNMMREHVPQETRIHYVITNGGKAPNVVPDFAEVYYYKKQIDSRTKMVIILQDNEEVRGTIEWYDLDSIKINREDGPNILLPKHSIKYMFKAEGK
jgi:amidohydrolase